MTTQRNLERRLAEHLQGEAPSRAPDWILRSALTTIDTTRQRRGVTALRRNLEMPMYAKLAAAAVVVIAVGAFALWRIAPSSPGGPSIPVPTPTASPSPAPTVAQTPAPSPRTETATAFDPPFEYTLPAAPEFGFGTRNDTYFEIRVSEWADAGHPGGLIVQRIGGGRADPCDQASAATAIEAGPSAVFDYLRSIPQLAVTNEAAATVGDLSAREATVLGRGDAACQEVWAWSETTESFIDGVELRLISFEVAGEHYVVTVFGEADNEGWAAMADAIVDSLQFPATSASPGG